VDRACQKKGPSTVIVIMMIMRVLVDKLLRHDSRGWSPVFENLPVRRMWVDGYAPLSSVLNSTAPHKPARRGACPVLKGPQVVRRGPYGQVVGFCSFYGHGGKPSIIHSRV
jgi:hypothetical protein